MIDNHGYLACGNYDRQGDLIELISLPAILKSTPPAQMYGQTFDREQYHGAIAHEIAHAVFQHNCAEIKDQLTNAAREYLAHATQLGVLSDRLCRKVLPPSDRDGQPTTLYQTAAAQQLVLPFGPLTIGNSEVEFFPRCNLLPNSILPFDNSPIHDIVFRYIVVYSVINHLTIRGIQVFTIKAISVSDRKGIRKKNIEATELIAGFGLKNDAHAGKWHRQVSFLAEESIKTMRAKGLDVVAGNFAENITTEGFDLTSLKVGTHLRIGKTEMVISQLGKICHTRCAIYYQAGDCVMPREGIFGVILKGGYIRVGDSIEVQDKVSQAAAIIGSKETETDLGDQLKDAVQDKFKPVFIRFDTISDKEGGSLAAILHDLTGTQGIKNIVVFDPSGSLGLTLAGLISAQNHPNRYQMVRSTIDYCRSLEELQKI